MDFKEIEVTVNEKILKFDKFWLRDHCRCEVCFDHTTQQRKTNILDISDDISTKSERLIDEKLHIICKFKKILDKEVLNII